MKNKRLQRYLSSLLAMVMLLSLIPAQVFATEDVEMHDHEHEAAENPLDIGVDVPIVEDLQIVDSEEEGLPDSSYDLIVEEDPTESEVVGEDITADLEDANAQYVRDIVADMDAFLVRYGITEDMTDEEIEAAIYEFDDEAFDIIADIEERMNNMPEVDVEAIEFTDEETATIETYGRFCAVLENLNSVSFFAATSGTHTPVTGVTVGVSGATDNSMSNGKITVTAKGSAPSLVNWSGTAKTSTITVYNDTTTQATISFDWTATSVNELKIDGTIYTGESGSFSKLLAAKTSFEIKITTAKNSTENKLVLSSFTWVEPPENSSVTFKFDDDLGSVSVNGNAIDADETVEVSVESGATIVAMPNSGSQFLGWIDDATGIIISRERTYTIKPTENSGIQAVFSNPAANAWFEVNNGLYNNLNTAVTKGAKVVLAADGTLPEGVYTIPSGVTLLIPYDDAYTLCTTKPTVVEREYTTHPTAYRTLTITDKTTITVNGALSISGTQNAKQECNGEPIGPLGFIDMKGGTITIADGGELYAWGYITDSGSGKVVAQSGSTVYECFQTRDWRGGTAVSDMLGNDEKVFPMSQYYVQNIEVPLQLEAGAIEFGYTSVAISYVGIQGSEIPFFGSTSGLFRLSKGNIIKDYDEETDRLIVYVNGKLSMSEISLSMKLSFIGTKTITSSDYVLPINSNISIYINSGSAVTITESMALLPGSEIIIDENASCTLADGAKIFLYNAGAWTSNKEGKFVYGNVDVAPLHFAAGKTPTRGELKDAVVKVNGTMDASDGEIYTVGGSTEISSDGTNATPPSIIVKPGEVKETYQAVQGGSEGKDITYVSLSTEPVKLMNANANEKYVATGEYEAGTYEYIDGAWHCYDSKVVASTCTEEGYTVYKCTVDGCNFSYIDDYVEALGHSWTDANCTTPKTCSACGAMEGNALGHKWDDANCTTPKTCSVCQETEGEALGHSWTDADCDTPKNCSICGATEGEALGHSWTDADCDTPKNCSVCGETEGEALGHKWADANCTTPKTCSVCGATEGEALGHSWIDADCDTPKTCAVCGATEGEALGHSWTDADCDTPKNCSVCGETEGEALGHKWADANCTTPKTCSVCGATEGEALGHSWTAADCDTPKTCSVCGETEGEALGHSWTDTDCITPKTCSVCGETEGEALGHSWTDADCITPKTCSICGETEGEALGHSWTAADCDTPKTCSVCGETEGEALGHSWTDADCITPKTCSVCGETEGEALGHSWTDADCITPKTCSVCGETEGEALGHSWTAADCDTPKTCSVCGETEGEALGHSWTDADCITPKTCSVCGITEGTALGHKPHEGATCQESVTCDVCGTVIESQGDHTRVSFEKKPATCTEAGYEAGVKCLVCGTVLEGGEAINALEHDEIAHNAKAPSCTEIGWDAYVTCTRCNYTTYVEKDALDHDYVNHDAKDPTCTEKGWDAYQTCTRCDDTTYVEKTALDHDYINHDAKAPTCTEKGWDAYQTCTRCNYTTYQEKEALNHDKVTHDAKDPSCTEIGWDAFETCSRCNYTTYVEKTALDHDYVNHDAKAPNCTEIGWDAYKTCNRCDYSTYVEKAALDHGYVNHDAKAPTCTEKGWDAYQTCTRCSYTTYAEKEALDHGYVNHDAKTPTCTEKGWDAYQTCTRCDYTTYEEKAALNHDKVTHDAKTPSCTEIGWDTYETCTRCDYTTYVEKAALDHGYVNHEVKAPTCTEKGWDAYQTCTRCDYTTYVEKAALDHGYVNHDAKEPTCTEIGWDAYQTCTRCDYTTYAEKSALDHDIVNYDAKAAGCLTVGWEAYEACTRCDYTTYVEIEALGHDEVEHEALDPTCTEVGHDAYVDCTRCDYTTYVEVAALDHDYQDQPGKNPTYTQSGWEPYQTCSRCEWNNFVGRPALGEPKITSYEEFLTNLNLLEQLAQMYAKENPGKDPVALVIKYIRTGVDRYNSGSWGIMAGYEDKGFSDYVRRMEASINDQMTDVSQYLKISGLKNIENFNLPNGDYVDFGHMFGTMDITHHNKGSQNHADVGGWAGDLVDLMTASDLAYNNSTKSAIHYEVPEDLETMVDQIRYNIFLKTTTNDDKFNLTDFYGDIDALHVMTELYQLDYEAGDMTEIIRDLCTEELNDVDRAETFLKIRLGYQGTRAQVREAVYSAYSSNKTITTLESTRDFLRNDAAYLAQLRRAVCYAFADYVCELAGDYVDVDHNPYYTDFYTESSTLAPGIIYEKHMATSADDKQMVYYLATADITNPYVTVNANYTNADPSKWEMGRVLDQANAAQTKYGDPDSEHYIENYQVIVSVNSDGFNMTTGEPGGLLVMDGKEWHPINSSGFFGITKDGKAVIGTTKDYNNTYKGQLRDAVGAFGTMLVKDGEIAISASSNYYNSRASRTAVGITKTGKVVVMVLDGRQEPVSCGGSMEEIAQIMLEAGCYQAVNLDGGGSTTFVSKPEGEDALRVTNVPSDGFARSVSSTLVLVSTAPSSTAFHHAKLESAYDYVTIGTPLQMEAIGVSATGNVAEIPTGAAWSVSNELWGSITEEGVFTGLRNGSVDVILSVGEEEVGRKTINVVVPESVYFTRDKMDVVYGASIDLPVAALYEGKNVAITKNDVTLTVNPAAAGSCEGYKFTAAETNVKTAKITVTLKANSSVTGMMTVNLFNQGENTFDFDGATAGDRQLAWERKVTNSVTSDDVTYNAVNPNEDMVTSYIFAMDMTQIPIPDRLSDLVFMLPGADAVDASAWNFLLQLAERVSVLTEVKPVIKFDPRFTVDYSELKVMNDYFVIQDRTKDIEYNEETNEITLTLHWVDQTQAIEPSTANPLCIVSGVKLIPKDDAFEGTERITVKNEAVISYKIYLRASALYSFSQKKENQEIFGLMPFTNTFTDPYGAVKDEAGGYFASVYKQIEDQYTLSYAKQEGWVHEGTGYAYYVNGEKLTGVHKIGDYYYDFGENGINVGQTKFTGVFEDEGGLRFIRVGEPVSAGWHSINEDAYHVHEDGFAYPASVENPRTCIKGGYNTYECSECNLKERVGDFLTPVGHDWDENHVCRKCGTVGIDITTATFGFGTLKNPVKISGTVRYYYSKGGVRPYIYCTFDGKNELSWSGDGNVDQYGYVKDLYVTWPNNNGIGKAFVEITGRGNYYGKYTLEYQIIPRDVTNLRAVSVTDGAVTLAWDKALGADHYVIYSKKDNVRTYIATTTDTTCKIAGLVEGEVYNFQVASAAKSTDGENKVYTCAAWSNTVTIPESAAPSTPTTPTTPPSSGNTGGGSGSGGGGASGGMTEEPPVKVEIKQELEPEVTTDKNGKVEFEVGDTAIKNGVQDAIANQESKVEVKPVVSGDAKEVTTVITKESVDELTDKNVGVAVSSPVAGIAVKSESLNTVDGALELKAVDNNDGTVTISTSVDGKAKDLKDVTVTVPFGQNVAEKDNKGNVLVIVNEDGTETVVKKSVVDSSGVSAIVDSNVTVKVVEVTKEFPDTEGHWGESAIDFVASREIFSGTGTGFDPNGTMTRAMIVTTLYHLEDATARGSHSFPDVPSGKWYSDPVTWASREKIVSGTGRGFEPNANVTRQQLAVMLYNYAEFVGMDTSARGDLSKFGDHTRVSGWAKEAMEWAIGSGLISGMGNGSLNPQGQATRAQAAVIYEKLIKQMVK